MKEEENAPIHFSCQRARMIFFGGGLEGMKINENNLITLKCSLTIGLKKCRRGV